MAYKLHTPRQKHLSRAATLSKGLALGLSICLSAWSLSAHAQVKFYRYVNDQGTKVIASSIPPQYVRFGYEVLAANGRVIQVVPPEPEPEDRERVLRERALLEEYKVLARRYSTSRDIIAARDRRVAHLDANIAILRGNISNLKSQIENHMGKAASHERAGNKIPAHIFTSIDELREEVKNTEEVLRLRLQDHDKIMQKFADDVELFEKGQAMENKQYAAEAPETP